MDIKSNRSRRAYIAMPFLLSELASKMHGEKIIIDQFKTTLLGQVISCLADNHTTGALL
jgi:hypothetical protein